MQMIIFCTLVQFRQTCASQSCNEEPVAAALAKYRWSAVLIVSGALFCLDLKQSIPERPLANIDTKCNEGGTAINTI